MNDDCFRRTVEELAGRVYNHAAYMLRDQEEARDIVQETFVRMWRHREQIDGAVAARAWALRTAHNLALDRLRDRVNGAHVDFDDAGEIASTALAADRSVAREELRGQIQRGLAELRPADRAILLLREVQGLSYEELAQVFGAPLGTVKAILHRARARLRRRLSAAGVRP